MTPHRLALLLAAVQIAACAFTAADKTAILTAESLACTLAPVVLPSDVPAGIEAQACALAEDATKAIPVSEQAVREKAREVAAAPPTQARHVVAGHGVVVDKRVVVGMRVDGGTK